MKTLKLSKEGALVHSNWRQLIRGVSTEEDIEDSVGLMCLFLVPAHLDYPGLKGCKTVVVIVFIFIAYTFVAGWPCWQLHCDM